jgi:hypothetical protein
LRSARAVEIWRDERLERIELRHERFDGPANFLLDRGFGGRDAREYVRGLVARSG